MAHAAMEPDTAQPDTMAPDTAEPVVGAPGISQGFPAAFLDSFPVPDALRDLYERDREAYNDILVEEYVDVIMERRTLNLARAQMGLPVASSSAPKSSSPGMQTQDEGQHMGRLAYIPAELLEHIFVSCGPCDLAALSQTCKGLHRFLRKAQHVWEDVYARKWDVPERRYGRTARHDALLTLAAPCRKDTPSRKGKELAREQNEVPKNMVPALARQEEEDRMMISTYQRWRDLQAVSDGRDPTYLFGSSLNWKERWSDAQNLRKIYVDEHIYPAPRDFDLREQTQRRIWAENKIKNVKSRPLEVLSHYNPLMQTLLSVARSRSVRVGSSDLVDHSATAEYLERLLNHDNCEAFRRLVYPRTDLHCLREWQLEYAHKRSATESPKEKKDGRKRTQSTQSNDDKKRQKMRSSTGARRRSTRLMLSQYPVELQHLLCDHDGNPHFDGNGNPVRLEDIDAIDEQFAAELHVLHGILPARAQTQAEDIPVFVGEEGRVGEALGLFDNIDGPHPGLRFFNFPAFDLNLSRDDAGESSTSLRARAREIVYDTARYGPENSYGPLKAWRKRIAPIDGRRESANDEDDEEESLQESFHPSDDERDDMDTSDGDIEGSPITDHDDPRVVDLTNIESESDSENDDEFDPDDSDMGDFEALDHLYNGERDLHMRMTRGMLPWLESERLAKLSEIEVDLPLKGHETWGNLPNASMVSCWGTDKRVDWITVEAIMIVMSCNIRNAILQEGWGQGYRLPGHDRSLTGRDAFARRALEDMRTPLWKDVLGLPCGWDHSRAGVTHAKRKSWDWANVEATWIGTYAFLDWHTWSIHNSRDPHYRGYPLDATEESRAFSPVNPLHRDTSHDATTLEDEREAVGDCLQLRMELLPLEKEQDLSEEEKLLDRLLPDDDGRYFVFEKREQEYPTLKFRGQTMNVLDDGQVTPRGAVHGSVRPIFAPRSSGYNPRVDGRRAVVAMHWEITHRYDGEDRWSLSGVQAGPPGTRAPIYGIWGASDRLDNTSPCGPFAYYMVDERPWKDVADLLAAEDRAAR